jgi:3-phenylpropionate/trans-cinnamate dioxygenase ferredoxin reductase subunit
MVGLSDGYDTLVLRGSPEGRSFIAFYLKGGQVIAADSVNRPGDFMAAKRLVGDRSRLSADQLADEAVSLKALIAKAA